MAKLHIFNVDLALNVEELQQYGVQIQDAIRAQGRPNDKVIVVSYGKYLTSLDLEEGDDGAQ